MSPPGRPIFTTSSMRNLPHERDSPGVSRLHPAAIGGDPADRPAHGGACRHADRLRRDGRHRPARLGHDRHPGAGLDPAGPDADGGDPVDHLRCHPAAQHAQAFRRHHGHPQRFLGHQPRPSRPGHHRRLAVRLLHRGRLGLRHAGRGGRAADGGARLPGAGRRGGRHDDPVHPGLLRRGGHADRGRRLGRPRQGRDHLDPGGRRRQLGRLLPPGGRRGCRHSRPGRHVHAAADGHRDGALLRRQPLVAGRPGHRTLRAVRRRLLRGALRAGRRAAGAGVPLDDRRHGRPGHRGPGRPPRLPDSPRQLGLPRVDRLARPLDRQAGHQDR